MFEFKRRIKRKSEFASEGPMTTTKITPSWLPLANPVSPFSLSRNLFLSSCPLSLHFPLTAASTPRHLTPARSSGNGEQRETSLDLKGALSSIVNDQVGELLNREENRALLDGLEKASLRVEMAKRQLAEIEKLEIEEKQMRNYVMQLENKATEIAECQMEILQARAMIEEAEKSLSANGGGNIVTNQESGVIDRDKERVESIKAALVSALVGTLAGLPIALTQVSSAEQLVLPLGITIVSCALFGVTFRYTIRRDLDDVHLKTGTSAAFAVVKGLGELGSGSSPLEVNMESLWKHGFDGAVYVVQNLYIFVFAAVALDFCFKINFLSPFPIRGTDSKLYLK